MRIVLVHYSAPPVVGGVEAVLAHHARLMTAAGHTPLIVAGRGAAQPGAPVAALPLLDSRHPRVLEAKHHLDASRVPPEFSGLQAEIAAALRPLLEPADVVVMHNVCGLHKNLALTAALHALSGAGLRTRFVAWHHDLAWTAARYQPELHAGHPWDLLRRAWPGVRQAVVSEQRRQEWCSLTGLPPEAVMVIPNGVDGASLLKLEAQTETLAARMNLAALNPLLLLPVRLTRRKNIELALRATAALRQGGPDWTALPAAGLLVTGPEGPHNPANAAYRQELLRLRDELGLRGAAHFAAEHSDAYLPATVVADFYRLADALLLPSREEGFGLPLIEAALARLPVFCSDIPPLRALGLEQAVYFPPEAEPGQVARLVARGLARAPQYLFAARIRQTHTWDGIYRERIAPLLEP